GTAAGRHGRIPPAQPPRVADPQVVELAAVPPSQRTEGDRLAHGGRPREDHGTVPGHSPDGSVRPESRAPSATLAGEPAATSTSPTATTSAPKVTSPSTAKEVHSRIEGTPRGKRASKSAMNV